MRFIKISGIIIVSLFGLVILWFNLATSILYYSEIKQGNGFIENIRKYQKRNGKLQDENQWDTLAILNPIKPYENFYPEYRKINANNFYITYIEGFDSPYLQYDTMSKKWEMK